MGEQQLEDDETDVVAADESFQFAIDVPGVKATDMKVSVDDDGKTLWLRGERLYGKENTKTFSKRWSLESAPVDSSLATAKLLNGVLTITVPKDLEKMQEKYQKVPVVRLEKNNNDGEAIANVESEETWQIEDGIQNEKSEEEPVANDDNEEIVLE